MRRSKLLMVIGLAVALLFGGAARATDLLSENFDELTPGAAQTSVGAFHTINGTNVDVVGDINGNWFASLCASPESGNCIDMDGSYANAVATLQSNTDFTLLPGVNYYLSFDLIGNQRTDSPEDSSVTVSLGPYDQTFNLSEFDDTDGIVSDALIQVSSVTDSYLTFTSNDPDDDQQGELLDDVLLTSAPQSSVPEPASLSLFAGGFIALGLVRRRMR